jgi:hypothetical protein
MLPIEEEVCNWHLKQLKGLGFASKKLASMKSQTEFEWTNHSTYIRGLDGGIKFRRRKKKARTVSFKFAH